ncbi:MAG: inositol monophosphatase [Gammaproteobacteria bacterium]|nr:MAG: inositol monophosphatase [Gammaproteobacteria bacterium]
MEPMLTIALRAAREAGEYIVRAGERLDRLTVESKSVNDYVSEVDREAERILIEALKAKYPDHGFLAEESTPSDNIRECEYLWVIDPLDGTTNFLRGIPHYAVSIACYHKGRLEHAIVLDPVRREEFTASRGRGAQLNGKRIRVSGRNSLEGALLGTGVPFKSRFQEHMPAYLQTLDKLALQTAGIRRAGAAALDLAYVAAGRLDGFWEIGLQEWDIAAGALLIQEAGGLISDVRGGADHLHSGHVVCATPKCFKPMLQVIQPTLGYLQKA